jgi:hypothetical protein
VQLVALLGERFAESRGAVRQSSPA